MEPNGSCAEISTVEHRNKNNKISIFLIYNSLRNRSKNSKFFLKKMLYLRRRAPKWLRHEPGNSLIKRGAVCFSGGIFSRYDAPQVSVPFFRIAIPNPWLVFLISSHLFR